MLFFDTNAVERISEMFNMEPEENTQPGLAKVERDNKLNLLGQAHKNSLEKCFCNQLFDIMIQILFDYPSQLKLCE